MLILFVYGKTERGPLNKLGGKPPDFRISLFDQCNIPCKYSASRLDDVAFPSEREVTSLFPWKTWRRNRRSNSKTVEVESIRDHRSCPIVFAR